MATFIDIKKIEEALASAREKLRENDNGNLSERYIEAKTAIECFEYVFSLCKTKRPYPQIEGHPLQMTQEEASSYDKPVMVGHNGEVKMCMLLGGSYYEYDYTIENRGSERGWKGPLFCSILEAEAIRGCSGFDF